MEVCVHVHMSCVSIFVCCRVCVSMHVSMCVLVQVSVCVLSFGLSSLLLETNNASVVGYIMFHVVLRHLH